MSGDEVLLPDTLLFPKKIVDIDGTVSVVVGGRDRRDKAEQESPPVEVVIARQ